MSQPKLNNRLMSLDTLRGFDMLFIMGGSALLARLCNWFNTPFWLDVAEQTKHVGWNGLHMEDCIFPLFLFIAGISFPFSLEKQRTSGRSTSQIYRKVVTRGIVLVLLGFLYNGFLSFDFENMRYASVLGRIGLAWMFSAIIFMNTGLRGRLIWLASILVGYWLAMRFWPMERPDGIGWFDPEGTIARAVDMAWLPGQKACGGGTYDPEGLLSTIPAIGTALMGMLTGAFIKCGGALSDGGRKALKMAGAALILVAIGLAWNEVFPINKRMWSSSFACVVGGISLILFALFYYIVDVRGLRKWTLFFRVIGLNAITIYLGQKFIAFWPTADSLFGGFLRMIENEAPRLCAESVCYIAVCWGFLYFLYRKNVFLKV